MVAATTFPERSSFKMSFRIMFQHALRPVCLLALLGSFAAADGSNEPQSLDEIVVSARGRASLVSQTPGSVSLLGGEEIRLEHPLSLTNASRRLPGVEKSSDSAWGSEINIRGLGRNRIVYLLDGARINTATDFNAQFGMIDPNDVERVEVIKGGASSLYGSGAIGGVVNVVTRGATFTPEQEVHGGLTLSGNLNPGGLGAYGWSSISTEDYYLFLTGSGRQFDEYRNADGETIDNSQFDDYQWRIRLGHRWNAANTTEIQYLEYNGHEIGIPGRGLSNTLPADDRQITYPDAGLKLLSLTHTSTPDSPFWSESKLRLYRERITRNVLIDQIPPTSDAKYPIALTPNAVHDTWGANWQNTFDLGKHTLVWGVDAWRWEYVGDRQKYIFVPAQNIIVVATDYPLGDSEETSTGLFAEDDWRLSEKVTLNLGGRTDYIVAETDANPTGGTPEKSFHDVSWTAHAGLTWQFAPAWSATFLAASSYRAPDLLDRFKVIALTGSTTLYGNSELDPEQSVLLETGLHYTGETIRGSASIFANFIDDLIAAKPIAGSGGDERMENVSEAEFQGVELEGEWRFAPGWSAYGCISLVEAEDKTEDEYLRFTPPLNGLLGARYDHPSGLWTSLELDWAARQNHLSPEVAEDTPAWITLNAKLGYRFMLGESRQHVSLALNNLANADYQNHLSTSRGIELREPGFNASAAWTAEF
jgi:hemoglobin/transferrin/lactoferrin receptor protein